MNNVDEFLNAWVKQTTAVEYDANIRRYGNMLVQLSKSGRFSTVRVNFIKSAARRQGEASAFLNWLNEQADKYDFAVTMCVQPVVIFGDETALRKDQLLSWVKKYGYKVRYDYPDGNGTEVARVSKNAELPSVFG